MSAAAVEVEADLSDLDLLDDDQSHARCTICYPDLGVVFVAICGRRAIHFKESPADSIPANACEDCVRLYEQPCSRCGS